MVLLSNIPVKYLNVQTFEQGFWKVLVPIHELEGKAKEAGTSGVFLPAGELTAASSDIHLPALA